MSGIHTRKLGHRNQGIASQPHPCGKVGFPVLSEGLYLNFDISDYSSSPSSRFFPLALPKLKDMKTLICFNDIVLQKICFYPRVLTAICS